MKICPGGHKKTPLRLLQTTSLITRFPFLAGALRGEHHEHHEHSLH
jgi:hypothetical protein